jgi:hypothetical protein
LTTLCFLDGFLSPGTTAGAVIGSGSNNLLASAATIAAARASAAAFLFSALVVCGSFFGFPTNLSFGGFAGGGVAAGGGVGVGSTAGFGNPLGGGAFTNPTVFSLA